MYRALGGVLLLGETLTARLIVPATAIDPASYTGVRLLSGALTLWLVTTLAALSGAVTSGLGYVVGFAVAARSIPKNVRSMLQILARRKFDVG